MGVYGLGDGSLGLAFFSFLREPDGSEIGNLADGISRVPRFISICILESQDVLLDKGYTKIEDIQPGDTIDGSEIGNLADGIDRFFFLFFRV